MFTYPPYPPKDYVLKRVPKIQTDSQQFTPDSGPRVTQSSLGLFCSPVDYQEGESPEKIQVQSLSPHVLEKWTNYDRAWWVDKPGKDDRYLHQMFKKYNVECDNYNPNYMHKEKVFNRSYKFEQVCLQEHRLGKLREKCEKEQSILFDSVGTAEKKEDEDINPTIKILDCKAQPPFWWKQSTKQTGETNEEEEVRAKEEGKSMLSGTSSGMSPTGRWAKAPCLTAVVVDDPCRRKYDMQLVGQPFRTEACNFYYENYPPPAIKFRPKKFS